MGDGVEDPASFPCTDIERSDMSWRGELRTFAGIRADNEQVIIDDSRCAEGDGEDLRVDVEVLPKVYSAIDSEGGNGLTGLQ